MLLEQHSSIENNTSLDTKSFGIEQTPFFFKILSSSLYERKEEAVLRELSANALDAHIMAGIQDTPIEVILPNELSPELVIRDFGTGMSLLTLEEVYTVYGSSTKRNDNINIGAFGMGSKSPFALTDSFTVESTHNGITTNIACYLDEGQPKFSVFSSTRTGNPSGTTVRVPVPSVDNQKALIKAAETIYSYWTTLPTIKGAKVTDNLSNYLLYTNDLVYVTSRYSPIVPYNYGSSDVDLVTIGPFYYTIPAALKERLSKSPAYNVLSRLTLHSQNGSLSNVSYTLKFNIGDLELAPSRERIEDTPLNYQKIQQKINTLSTFVLGNPQGTHHDNYLKLVNLVLEKGIRGTDFKTLDFPEVLLIQKHHIDNFFASIVDSSNNPLTTAYYSQHAFKDIKDLLPTIDTNPNLLRALLKLDDNLLPYLRNVSNYSVTGKEDTSLSSLVTGPHKQVNVYSLYLTYLVSQLRQEREVIERLFSNLNVTSLDILNNKYRHSGVSFITLHTLLDSDKTTYILIQGSKTAKTTKLINSVLKNSLIATKKEVVTIYTNEVSIKDLADDINKYYTLFNKGKTFTYLTEEDFVALKDSIPKPTRTVTTSKTYAKRDERVVANLVSFSSDIVEPLTVSKLYDPSFYSQYEHIVTLSPSTSVSKKDILTDTVLNTLLSKVLVIRLKNSQERNTKRYENLVSTLRSSNYIDSSYTIDIVDIWVQILKTKGTSTVKDLYKQTVLEQIKLNLFSYNAFVGYAYRKHLNLFNEYFFDLGHTEQDYVQTLPFTNKIETIKDAVLKNFFNSLTPRTRILFKAIYNDTVNRHSINMDHLDNTLKECPQIFFKKELSEVKRVFNQSTKNLGDLYDSTFKDIINADTNT